MRTSSLSQNFFDTRSVLLFAALTMGGSAALQTRATEPAPARPATTTPATRPPALAQPKAAPPPFPALRTAQRADAAQPSAAHSAFERADRDRDGQLTPSEAQRLPAISERFTEIDTDQDGKLSRQEFDTGSRT